MADMSQKPLATENTEEMVDMADPPSRDSSSGHLEEQMSSMNHDAIADKNESETVDWTELPYGHGTPPSISSNQRNDQMEDEVIIDIKSMIEDSEEGLLSTTCCIYRVPHVIRKLKEDAYTPRAVSIGPFHYGNKMLQNMERHKSIFFKRFAKGAMTSLDDLVNFVKHSESRVRSSYSENIKLSKKELVKVTLVDAGFIIELFRRFKKEGWLVNDAKLSKPWLVDIIIADLLLLENQLPFFFLEELFNRAFPPNLRGDIPSFRELTFDFFSDYNVHKLEPNPNVRIEHFIDLLRTFQLQRQEPCQRHRFEEATSHVLLYSAHELHEAGVKFKASTKGLLHFKFSGRVLEIPQILVEDRSETLFRNMIALEQCHYPFKSYVTDFALVLVCLINTSKDVDVLIQKKVIQSHLADTNSVAQVFNGLWKNIIQVDFNSDYLDTCKRLNRFYQNPWHRKKASLRSDYCKTPWQTAASIAGILLIILSLVQATCSVLQVALQI